MRFPTQLGASSLAAWPMALAFGIGSFVAALPSSAHHKIRIHYTEEVPAENPCDPSKCDGSAISQGIQNPNFADPDGTLLFKTAEAAAEIWEDLLPDLSGQIDIYLEYDDDIAGDGIGRALPFFLFWSFIGEPWNENYCPESTYPLTGDKTVFQSKYFLLPPFGYGPIPPVPPLGIFLPGFGPLATGPARRCWEIEIDPTLYWFADPTPHENEEFGPSHQTRVVDLPQVETDDYFKSANGEQPPDVLEIGFYAKGIPPSFPEDEHVHDLLTTMLHEIGHTLGISVDKQNPLNKLYPLNKDQIFGIEGVSADSYSTGGPGGLPLPPTVNKFFHLEPPDILMTEGNYVNYRTLPSAFDVLASANRYGPADDTDLARQEYQGTGAWGQAQNWLGGSLPDAEDLAFIRMGAGDAPSGGGPVVESKVQLNGDAEVGQLIVDEGGSLSTGSFTLRVGIDGNAPRVDLDKGCFPVADVCLRGRRENAGDVLGEGGGITISSLGELETNRLSILESVLTMRGGTLRVREQLRTQCNVVGETCPWPGVLEGSGRVTVPAVAAGEFVNLANSGQIRTDNALPFWPLVLENTGYGAFDLDGFSQNSNPYPYYDISDIGDTPNQPRLFTVPNHPFQDDDIVDFIEVLGATKLNFGAFTVKNVIGDTFNLETTNVTANLAPYEGEGKVRFAPADIGELGQIFVTEGDLIINSPLTDPFDGDFTIDPTGWYSRRATFLRNHEFGPGAFIDVRAGGHLELGGLVYSLGPRTTFSGGSYVGQGFIHQNGPATVAADTTIETRHYDWDGDENGAAFPSSVEVLYGGVATNPRRVFRIDSYNIDPSDNAYDGTTSLYGSRLEVNTRRFDELNAAGWVPTPWTLDAPGTLRLFHSSVTEESTKGKSSVVSSYGVDIFGTVEAFGHRPDLEYYWILQDPAHLIDSPVTLHPGARLEIHNDSGTADELGLAPLHGILRLNQDSQFRGGVLSGDGKIEQAGKLVVTGSATVSSDIFDFDTSSYGPQPSSETIIDGGRLLLKAVPGAGAHFHSDDNPQDADHRHTYLGHMRVRNGGVFMVHRSPDPLAPSPVYDDWILGNSAYLVLQDGGHVSGSDNFAYPTASGGSAMRVRGGKISSESTTGLPVTNSIHSRSFFESDAYVAVSAHSRLSLVGKTTYAGGTYVGYGVLSQEGNAAVMLPTTFGQGLSTFDLDGLSEAANIEIYEDLTIESRIEETGPNKFDGSLDIFSPSTLTMKPLGISQEWEMAGITFVNDDLGTLDGAGFCSFTLEGHKMKMTGQFHVRPNSCARINVEACTGTGAFWETYNGQGELILDNVINVGCSLGTMRVNGDVRFGPNSKLVVELLGNTPRLQDHVVVSGELTVQGRLEIVTGGSFVPVVGLLVDFIDANSIQGDFTQISATPMGPGLGWDFSTVTTTGSIRIVLLDEDEDDVGDDVDNCLGVANRRQFNADGDAAGDACDDFPDDPAETTDTDGDGTGDNADTDDDGDGFPDSQEIASGSDPLDPESIPDSPISIGFGIGPGLPEACSVGAGGDLDCLAPPGTPLNFNIIIHLDERGMAGYSFGAVWDEDLQAALTVNSATQSPFPYIEVSGGPPPVTVGYSPLEGPGAPVGPGGIVQSTADSAGQLSNWQAVGQSADPAVNIPSANHSFRAGKLSLTVDDAKETAVQLGWYFDSQDAFLLASLENLEQTGPGQLHFGAARINGGLVDSDGDGTGDAFDAFPNDAAETKDTDGDEVGDNADVCANDADNDADGDDVCGDLDAFPNDASETTDTDDDGIGDNADEFPEDPSEWNDADGDRVGDNADAFPNNSEETVDTDEDRVGNNADDDDDNDELWDWQEVRLGTDPLNADTDGDGIEDGLELAMGTNPRDASSVDSYSAGSLLGDIVRIEHAFPTEGEILLSDAVLVSEEEAEIECGWLYTGPHDLCPVETPSAFDYLAWKIDVEANSISITFPLQERETLWNEGDFNGLRFLDLDWPGQGRRMAGVAVDTNFEYWDDSRVAFTDDSVSINFPSDAPITAASYLNLELQTLAIPEPASALLQAAALLTLLGMRRRRIRAR